MVDVAFALKVIAVGFTTDPTPHQRFMPRSLSVLYAPLATSGSRVSCLYTYTTIESKILERKTKPEQAPVTGLVRDVA
jgi:hypothetical protein